MLITTPLWLWLLVPWAALVVWLMWARHDRVAVPFIDLWRSEVLVTRNRRALRLPPASILCVLLAVLLAIIAAAGPAHIGYTPSNLAIIIDNGISMSGQRGNVRRFVALATEVSRKISDFDSTITLIAAADGSRIETDARGWVNEVRAIPSTALDTRDMVGAMVRRETASPGSIVLVLTDQVLPGGIEDAIQVVPGDGAEDVGITHVAARDGTWPQVMMTVRNQSSAERAELAMSSGDQRIQQPIELPLRGERNFFFNLKRLSQTIEARLIDQHDAISANDAAFLARLNVWPRVEARDRVPAEVERVVRAYATSRPPADDSPSVAVVSTELNDINSPAALLASGGAVVGARDAKADVRDHPLTSHVNWDNAVRGSNLTGAPSGWTPVVSVGDIAVIAIHTEPFRQAWIGIDSSQWARSADFVVFWTDLLDWLGASSAIGDFGYTTTTRLGDEWEAQSPLPSPAPAPGAWPDLYHRSDGAVRAVNAPDVELNQVSMTEDWQAELLRRGKAKRHRGATQLAPPLLFLAITALGAAALLRGGTRRQNP